MLKNDTTPDKEWDVKELAKMLTSFNATAEPTITSLDECAASIANFLKKRFNAVGQKEVLLKVHKILEDSYIERIACDREQLENSQEQFKIFNS